MSRLLRWARPCVVVLLTLALVLGINGFVGAIHSVHHLSAPVTAGAHDAESHGHDGGDATPAGGPRASCPLAAAALNLAATAVEALPGLELAPAGALLVALGPQDAPRAASTEPSRGRAPPVPGTIPG